MKKQIVALISALFLSIGLAFAAVNVNTATQAELETLEGIGPVKAKAIIDYRTKNGPFKSVGDVEKVPGIGPSTLSGIRKDITLTGKTAVSADAKGGDRKDSNQGAKDSAKGGMKDAPKTDAKGRDDKSGKGGGKDDKAGSSKSGAEMKGSPAGKSDDGGKGKAGGAGGSKSGDAGKSPADESRDTKGRFVKKDEKKKPEASK